MSLMEIGQTLKKERKRQQLSLEDVYATTKIGMDILRAIEEADLNQMPHLVYARGFIRNYSNFLGLSGEDMVQAFDEAMEVEAVQATHRHRGAGTRKSADEKAGKKSGNKAPVGLVLLLVLVLAGLVYYFFLSPPAEQPRKESPAITKNASSEQEQEQAEMGPSEEANASSGERAAGTNRSAATASGVSDEGESEEEIGESSQSGQNGTSLARSEAEQEVEANRSTQEDNATARPASHELRIAASEACWINVDVEEGVRDFYLEPGQERTVQFRGTGSFILGNAGGVTLYLDGEEYSVQAESGEVREITLP